jgi:AcrR family transcriptional regulator
MAGKTKTAGDRLQPPGDQPQPAADRALPPQPPSPPWREEPQRRRRQAAHPGLDREQIVGAGLRLVDAEGAEALSLRRLAADLRVTPMALYWHVRDKAELLDLIGERVLESVVVPAPEEAEAAAAGDWRRRLRDVHLAMLGPILEHPNAVDLMVGRARFGRAGIALFERILEILLEAGLAPAAAFDAYQSLYLFQLGFTATARRSPEFRAIQAQGAAYLRSLDPAAFPAIAEVAPVIGARPLAEQYAVGLDVVIEGIAAALPRGEVAAG